MVINNWRYTTIFLTFISFCLNNMINIHSFQRIIPNHKLLLKYQLNSVKRIVTTNLSVKHPVFKISKQINDMNSKSNIENNFDTIINSNNNNDNEFIKLMKQYRKTSSSKKILNTIIEYSNKNELTQNMTLIGLKTLQRINATHLYPQIVPYFIKTMDTLKSYEDIEYNTTISIIHFYCKLQNMDSAELIVNKIGIYFDNKDHSNDINTISSTINDITNNNDLKYFHKSILSEMSFGYITINSIYKSLQSLKLMELKGIDIDLDMSKKILKQFLHNSKQDKIHKAIQLLLSLNGLTDNDSIQLITNSYLRDVDFIKGAVSIETLPPPLYPEVAFIGRSNVGKSSLINMICNRKFLAFTSKTPGKTSEFNYFDAKGIVGISKEPHRFYLVDLPGVGFARASKELRTSWRDLLFKYITTRDTLSIVFHLIDSRHGLLDADEECLSLLPNLLPTTQYIIVLTKVDKQKNIEKSNIQMNGIIDRIYKEVALRTDRVIPIISTSSDTKLGGTALLYEIIDHVRNNTSKDDNL